MKVFSLERFPLYGIVSFAQTCTLILHIYRELAYQISEQFRVFGEHIAMKDAVIVGGIGE